MPARRPPIEPRKQPRQARSIATVAAILEASIHILERDGLPAFTTNAVAERAGVGIGSLYQYFPSREALLTELIRRKRALLLQSLQEAAVVGRAGGLRTLVEALVHAGTVYWQKNPGLIRSLSYAEPLLPLDEETALLQRQILDVLAEALDSQGVERPREAARDLATLTYGMTDGAGAFGPTDPTTLEARILRAAVGYLGLCACGAGSQSGPGAEATPS